MPDAPVFSIDVAVAKARNTAYYDNPAELQPIDQLPGVAPGVSFTMRTPPHPMAWSRGSGSPSRSGLGVAVRIS